MTRVRAVRYGVASILFFSSLGVLASCGSDSTGDDSAAGGHAGQSSAAGHGGMSTGAAGHGGASTGASGGLGVSGSSFGQAGTLGVGGTFGVGGNTGISGSFGVAGNASAAGSTSSGGVTNSGGGGSTNTAGSGGKGGSTGTAGSNGTAGSSGNGKPLDRISGSSGFATRYWDCCKPACAWPGGQSMQSCDANDNPQGKGNNVKNACESGGNSFMCYDYEPWVDPNNSYVAYGFAAASGSNYVCGRCFEVQFNGSGHDGVNNNLGQKTMYLQVINNGGVQSNQFDILIPGGGVGALNACGKEWGSNTDLGQQYGGLYAECKNDINCTTNKCNTVFAGKPDLLSGCLWYLTWFTGADNPNITFKQVSCPSQLTSKSGMSG